MASPEGSISEEANAASLRPLTAASVLGRRLLVAEEEEGERVVASGGMRMEFLPENNTVILIEGTESTVDLCCIPTRNLISTGCFQKKEGWLMALIVSLYSYY